MLSKGLFQSSDLLSQKLFYAFTPYPLIVTHCQLSGSLTITALVSAIKHPLIFAVNAGLSYQEDTMNYRASS